MTGASAMLKVLQPRKGSMIALWGAGGVGCACVMAAVSGALEGGPPALLVVIDANADRLPLARELGATHTLDALRDDVPARLAELTGGDGLDFAIDCTGVPAVLTVAHAALAPMGTLLSIGAPRDRTVPAPFPMGVHLSQSKRYIGTIQGDAIPTQVRRALAVEDHRAQLAPVYPKAHRIAQGGSLSRRKARSRIQLEGFCDGDGRHALRGSCQAAVAL
jgi:Zn-dependent alcohol dehydrogenase